MIIKQKDLDILSLRLGRGLTLNEASAISGIPSASIESWEAGKTYPDLLEAKKLSLTYKCSSLKITTALVGRSNSANPELAIIPTRRDRIEAEKINQIRLDRGKDSRHRMEVEAAKVRATEEKAIAEKIRAEEEKAIAEQLRVKREAEEAAKREAEEAAKREAEEAAKRQRLAANISEILAGKITLDSLGVEDATRIREVFGKAK